MPIRLTVRAAIATALAIASLSFVAAAPALADAGAPEDAPSPEFFGMQSWVSPDAEDMTVLKRAGIGMVRIVFVGHLGRKRHDTRWAPYDRLMTSAAKERIEVVPTLLGTMHARPHRPLTAAGRRKWGEFVTDVARRYGRGGTFWAQHGDLEPMPLTSFQVWNEPNLPAYWSPATDAAGYVRFVSQTRALLRAVDPNVTIVLGGLPDSRLGMPALDYLRKVYKQPGARTAFDVVALHPYSRYSTGVMRALNRTRLLMDRRGDTEAAIWITELGWSTDGPRSQFRTTRRGQADRIRYTLSAMIAARERLRLERVIWFGLQDREYGTEEKPWWGPRVGLFDVQGRPKPGWNTFVEFTGGEPAERLRSVSARAAEAS